MKKVEPLVQQGHLPRTELMLAQGRPGGCANRAGAEPQPTHRGLERFAPLARHGGRMLLDPWTLDTPFPKLAAADLVREAEQRRPDLHALEVAVKEAQAALHFRSPTARAIPPRSRRGSERNQCRLRGHVAFTSPPVLNTRQGRNHAAPGRCRSGRAGGPVDGGHHSPGRERGPETADLRRRVDRDVPHRDLPGPEKAREGFDQLFGAANLAMTLARVIAIRHRLIQTASPTSMPCLNGVRRGPIWRGRRRSLRGVGGGRTRLYTWPWGRRGR